MPLTSFSKDSIKQSIVGKLLRYNGRTVADASPQQIYHAVAYTVRDQIMQKWVSSRDARKQIRGKRLFYLSVEFLTGRSLYCNMLNLCSTDEYKAALSELGLSIIDILPIEPDPGLGNGGLGRLAACFMDSLSSLDLPAMGCTIRYEYGLFKQKMVDGQQVELPDNWLQNGNAWEVAVMEDACEVHFGGRIETQQMGDRLVFNHLDYYTVEAVPYDMPIIGYDTTTVNPLRMWSARSPKRLDLCTFGRGEYAKSMEEQQLAEVISKVLYPEDNHYEGKLLRLKQHYFFTSATVQYIVKDFKRTYGTRFDLLSEKVVIHINDTHPGLAIPELMRILMDEESLTWEEAEAIVKRTFAYTNHTVLQEALERWPENMIQLHLPRIYMIIQEINKRLCQKLWNQFPGDWYRIGNMAVLSYHQVQMANLCIAMSFSVNGVSQLHGEILKEETFSDYYLMSPDKFSAITNGVTHRRWLMACNPGLSSLIDESIGTTWRKDLMKLQELVKFKDDAAFLKQFDAVKQFNKQRLAAEIKRRQGHTIDPAFIFDVQAKRLHEYKRQLLNALHILVLYNRIVDDSTYTMTPRTFIFGAKASPGYHRAKQIIRLIIAIAAKIDKHPRAKTMLKVIFLENYDVSYAEYLMPAAEVSEQISTASKEASGTGNMKFMMNGAVTIGTMDGANVEIYDQVGPDNIYIFGMRKDAVRNLTREGNYNPMGIFETNSELNKAMTQLIDGTLFPNEPATIQDLYQTLLIGDHSTAPDPYFVLKDFGSYAMAQRRVEQDYQNRDKWVKMALMNTALSGVFSSDNTIQTYNENIWRLPTLSHK